MNVMRPLRFVTSAALVSLAPLPLWSQNPAPAPAAPAARPAVTRLVAEPTTLTVEAGQAVPLRIIAYDAQGNVVPDVRPRLSAPRGAAVFLADGQVRALNAGQFEIVASVSAGDGTPPAVARIPVRVTWPGVRTVAVTADSGRLYTGVTLVHRARAFHADSSVRPAGAVTWRWSSSSDQIASVDRFGSVTAHRPGAVTITARASGV